MMDTWDEIIREHEGYRSKVRKNYQLSIERITAIKRNSLTKRICYPTHKEAFEYVHAIYPFANVKQAQVYQLDKYSLEEIGYAGMGGFYDTVSRIVVLSEYVPSYSIGGSTIVGEFTSDEVLCHELIHYAANFKNASSSREVEEEIAYGKSINYLRFKGRSDDFIIRKNMMPYLVSVVDKKPIFQRVLTARYSEKLLSETPREGIEALVRQEMPAIEQAIKEDAYKMGEKMIALYGDKGTSQNIVKPTFKRLDLDDDF